MRREKVICCFDVTEGIEMLPKEQLNQNVGDLIKYLCRLKIYELLLGLDKFAKGELLPIDCQAFFEDIMQFRYRYSDRKKN